MPFNVSGVFVRLYRWVTDRDNSIPIDSTRMDAEIDGMVAGMNAIVNQTQAFTGPVKSPAGTVLTPGHSFSNDPDTGMYRAAANTVGFSAGGANVFTMAPAQISAAQPMDMGSNKITGLAAGTAASDAVRFDQVVPPSGGQFTGPITLPIGSLEAPALQFVNALFGIYWVSGEMFIKSGASTVMGRLSNGTTLGAATSIVTREAGDARYMRQTWTLTAGSGLTGGGDGSANRSLAVDATVLRTTGAQTISAGAKTFQSNVFFDSTQQIVFFEGDTVDRDMMFFRRSGVAMFGQRLKANGDMEISGATGRVLRLAATTAFSFGDGDVFLENNTDDGDGAGICVRTSTNPTTGMIFSVRSSGGNLGLGVHQDKVTSSRSDIYTSTSNTGTGGNRVLHSGMAAGSIGGLAFASVNAGTPISFGSTVAGSTLFPAGERGSNTWRAASALSGTWRCLGLVQDNDSVTLWQRIS